MDEAMREAAAHGHDPIALSAWRIEASLDYEAINRAIDNGHSDALERLLAADAIEAASAREGLPSEADYLMHARCARGDDELAASCIQRGARLDAGYALEASMNIAANGLVRAASAWLAEHGDPPQAALQDCSHSFPALMQSRLDKLAIQGHLPPQAEPTPKARL